SSPAVSENPARCRESRQLNLPVEGPSCPVASQPPDDIEGKDRAGSAGGDATTVQDRIGGATLNAGVSAAGYLCGERLGLGGVVFIDANRDGASGAGDVGKGQVAVTLTDAGGGSVTTQTDSQGRYSFANLAPGAYTLQVTVPTGFGTSTPTSRTFTLPGPGAGAVDFGLTVSTLSGSVFDDGNNNGSQDGADAGLTTTVRLTDVNGNPVLDAYRFTGLAPGTYTVVEGPVAEGLWGSDAL